ncbi:unnamed protein product, partial [marine sediment metagenome]
ILDTIHIFKKSIKKLIGLFISLFLIFALGVTTSIAQQKTKIAGKIAAALTTHSRINVGDTEGHIIFLEEYEGTNVSTGKEKFMDGVQDVTRGFGDLVMGNGTIQVYGKLSLNGDTVFYKFQGKIAPTLSPEGKPVNGFELSFTYTKGTGKYENIQGSGTYKGFTSWGTLIGEWEGEYFIKK